MRLLAGHAADTPHEQALSGNEFPAIDAMHAVEVGVGLGHKPCTHSVEGELIRGFLLALGLIVQLGVALVVMHTDFPA
jgi:hypothetical protein